MIALHRSWVGSRRAPAHPFAAGCYVTDGRRLYRVLSRFVPGEPDAHAELEDCVTLEVRSCSPSELYSMRLRSVRGSG